MVARDRRPSLAAVGALLFVLFLVVPFAELTVIVMLGDRIGIPETLLLMIFMSALGAAMAKRQGLRVITAVRQRLNQGELPGKELVDGLLVFGAGALLLTPGFLTDVVGILLLVPFLRSGIRRLLRRSFERRLRFMGPATVLEARSTDLPAKELGA